MQEKEVFSLIARTIKSNDKFMDFNLYFGRNLNAEQLETYAKAVAEYGSQEMMFELLENVKNAPYDILIDGICKKGDIHFVSAVTEYAIENGLPTGRLAEEMFKFDEKLSNSEIKNASGLNRFYEIIEWLKEAEENEQE